MTPLSKKLIPAVAAAAIFLLGACGDDDESSEPPTPDPGDGAALEETGEGVLGDASADESSSDGEASGGGDQAFCDWFTGSGPNPGDWDPEEAASMTPPEEIADAYEAIVSGDTSLSLQSEVTNWVTENCF